MRVMLTALALAALAALAARGAAAGKCSDASNCHQCYNSASEPDGTGCSWCPSSVSGAASCVPVSSNNANPSQCTPLSQCPCSDFHQNCSGCTSEMQAQTAGGVPQHKCAFCATSSTCQAAGHSSCGTAAGGSGSSEAPSTTCPVNCDALDCEHCAANAACIKCSDSAGSFKCRAKPNTAAGTASTCSHYNLVDRSSCATTTPAPDCSQKDGNCNACLDVGHNGQFACGYCKSSNKCMAQTASGGPPSDCGGDDPTGGSSNWLPGGQSSSFSQCPATQPTTPPCDTKASCASCADAFDPVSNTHHCGWCTTSSRCMPVSHQGNECPQSTGAPDLFLKHDAKAHCPTSGTPTSDCSAEKDCETCAKKTNGDGATYCGWCLSTSSCIATDAAAADCPSNGTPGTTGSANPFVVKHDVGRCPAPDPCATDDCSKCTAAKDDSDHHVCRFCPATNKCERRDSNTASSSCSSSWLTHAEEQQCSPYWDRCHALDNKCGDCVDFKNDGVAKCGYCRSTKKCVPRHGVPSHCPASDVFDTADSDAATRCGGGNGGSSTTPLPETCSDHDNKCGDCVASPAHCVWCSHSKTCVPKSQDANGAWSTKVCAATTSTTTGTHGSGDGSSGANAGGSTSTTTLYEGTRHCPTTAEDCGQRIHNLLGSSSTPVHDVCRRCNHDGHCVFCEAAGGAAAQCKLRGSVCASPSTTTTSGSNNPDDGTNAFGTVTWKYGQCPHPPTYDQCDAYTDAGCELCIGASGSSGCVWRAGDAAANEPGKCVAACDADGTCFATKDKCPAHGGSGGTDPGTGSGGNGGTDPGSGGGEPNEVECAQYDKKCDACTSTGRCQYCGTAEHGKCMPVQFSAADGLLNVASVQCPTQKARCPASSGGSGGNGGSDPSQPPAERCALPPDASCDDCVRQSGCVRCGFNCVPRDSTKARDFENGVAGNKCFDGRQHQCPIAHACESIGRNKCGECAGAANGRCGYCPVTGKCVRRVELQAGLLTTNADSCCSALVVHREKCASSADAATVACTANVNLNCTVRLDNCNGASCNMASGVCHCPFNTFGAGCQRPSACSKECTAQSDRAKSGRCAPSSCDASKDRCECYANRVWVDGSGELKRGCYEPAVAKGDAGAPSAANPCAASPNPCAAKTPFTRCEALPSSSDANDCGSAFRCLCPAGTKRSKDETSGEETCVKDEDYERDDLPDGPDGKPGQGNNSGGNGRSFNKLEATFRFPSPDACRKVDDIALIRRDYFVKLYAAIDITVNPAVLRGCHCLSDGVSARCDMECSTSECIAVLRGMIEFERIASKNSDELTDAEKATLESLPMSIVSAETNGAPASIADFDDERDTTANAAAPAAAAAARAALAVVAAVAVAALALLHF